MIKREFIKNDKDGLSYAFLNKHNGYNVKYLFCNSPLLSAELLEIKHKFLNEKEALKDIFNKGFKEVLKWIKI